MRSSFPSQMCDGWEIQWSFFLKRNQQKVATHINTTSLCCVQLSAINDFTCCTTVKTCQDPGRDTDSNTANIDNWLQQVTEKNGPKKNKKKNTTTQVQEVQAMNITPGCDVQTDLICSRK